MGKAEADSNTTGPNETPILCEREKKRIVNIFQTQMLLINRILTAHFQPCIDFGVPCFLSARRMH